MTMVVVTCCFASTAAAAEGRVERKGTRNRGRGKGIGGEMPSEPMSPIIFVFIFISSTT
jgi:hypothetical protein